MFLIHISPSHLGIDVCLKLQLQPTEHQVLNTNEMINNTLLVNTANDYK
jgi:hypothetical protein